MPIPHTWASRTAAVAGAPLAGLVVFWATTRTSHAPLVAAAALLGLLTVLCTGRLLWGDNSFEARLGLVVLGGLQLTIGVLALTVGLPGRQQQPVNSLALATAVAAAVVLVSLGIDSWLRRASADKRQAPPHYAL